MARDYSSRRNSSAADRQRKSNGKGNSKGKHTRSTAPARPTPRKRAARGGPPGWLWMVCGLCIGLTIAAGFYVFARPAGTPAREQLSIATPESGRTAKPGTAEDAQHAADTPPADKDEKPRFSFYKMLPNYEVVIPEDQYPDHNKSASHGNTPAGEPPPSTSGSQASASQPATSEVEESGGYIIQAGSFSTHGDADRRKAELAMLGVSAQIVDVDLASGKTVYRVQSDSIDSSSELNDTLARLRDNRIDTLVMRANK